MPGELNSPYRRDPFTGDFYPRWNEADEVHQATLQESNGRVGFFLNEAPQLRIPSDFICMLLTDEYDEYGTALRENARLDAPDTDEFRVDYDAEDYFGFGFVEVNADLVGSWFLVGYWGLGTPPRWETYLNAQVNVSQDSAIEGDLIVGRKLAVVDEYDAEMFSAEGDVISAHGNRVRDVADAVEDSDAINKGQATELVETTAIEIAEETANAIHGTVVFSSNGSWTRPGGVRYVSVLIGYAGNTAELTVDLDAAGAPSSPYSIVADEDEASAFGASADSSAASLGSLAYPFLIAGRTLTGGQWIDGSSGGVVIRF